LIEYLTTWFENKGYEVTGYIGFDKPDQPKLFSANEGRKGQLVIETDNKTTGKQIDRILIEKLLKKKLDDVDNKLIKKHSTEFHTALDSVKICDPAIGSGAFPMGLLHEIFTAKQTLHTFEHGNTKTFDASGVKLNIIQNSIYGVDIEKGAVDIARLRFWLSLIVDEEKPKALPNLDYKIVVGNSLVSKLGDDIIDIDWTLNETSHGLFGADLAKQKGDLLKKISKEQKEFFSPDSDKKKLAADIRKLKIDLLITQLELMIRTQGIESKPTGSGKSIAKQSEFYLRTIGWKNTIKGLQSLKSKPDLPLHFFDWKLDFPEIMNDQVITNVGFDIVIANPPYIGQKGNKTLFEPLSKDPNFEKKMDYWYFFLHKSYFLSKSSGVCTFITPNYWVTTQGGKKLRKSIMDNYSIIEYINFNENAIFEAGVHTNIFLLKKDVAPNPKIKCTIYQNKYSDNVFNYRDLELNFTANQKEVFNSWTGFFHFLPENISSVINQLYSNCEKLSDNESEGENKSASVAGKKITNGICNINQGIITGKDRLKDRSSDKNEGIYILTPNELRELNFSKKELDYIRPFIKNSDINKFVVSPEHKYYIIYVDNIETEEEFNELPNIKKHLSKYREHLSKRYVNGVLQSAYKKGKWWALIHSVPIQIIKNQKIICPQRNRYNLFGFEESETYASADVYYISLNRSEYSLMYILAILNSKLVYFWLYWMGKRKGEMLELYFEPLQFIPIKIANHKTQSRIVEMTEKVITQKKNGINSAALEQEMDNLIYKLYELTYEEVKVIDPEFSLSKKEYEAIKLE
jgi:adenine-specific DNA-methyltransferase